MNADELLRHYEQVADAPHAATRLRRFVLDLAVRGKLLPQSAGDEQSAHLLELVDGVPSAGSSLPRGWLGANVGKLLDFKYGKGLPAGDRSSSGPTPVFGSNGVVGFTTASLTDQPSIIIGRKGSAGALKICDGPSWTTDVAYYVEPPPYFHLRYLYLALSALGLDALGKGVKPGLSRSDAYELELCVPPLAEQHRIVAKVDELVALCDRLEAARAERETARDRLVAATMARLNAPDAETFAEDARSALDALPALIARPDQVEQLRQAIVNLGVLGKLVAQDSQERAAELPPPRQHAAASGIDDRVFAQFHNSIALPPGWKIAPLAQVSEHIVDCPHTTPEWTANGELCVRTNQLRPRKLDLSDPRYVSQVAYVERTERLVPKEDDILYSREGGILGVACRIPKGVRLCLGQRLMLIRASSAVAADYLEIVLNSPFITAIAKRLTTGGAAPRVNMSTVRAYPIPVPPPAEQRRIVAKVDQLMAICDQLNTSLSSSAVHRARLLDALLRAALFPASGIDEPVDAAEAIAS